MCSPEDAQIILLETNSINQANLAVYKTKKKTEYQEWNLKWKFKKWGFSNFTIYIAKDTSELFVPKEESLHRETDFQYIPQGKIYFTNNINEIGYKTPNYKLEGVMKIKKGFTKLKLKKKDYKL